VRVTAGLRQAADKIVGKVSPPGAESFDLSPPLTLIVSIGAGKFRIWGSSRGSLRRSHASVSSKPKPPMISILISAGPQFPEAISPFKKRPPPLGMHGYRLWEAAKS
jgi:hypothetical protein